MIYASNLIVLAALIAFFVGVSIEHLVTALSAGAADVIRVVIGLSAAIIALAAIITLVQR